MAVEFVPDFVTDKTRRIFPHEEHDPNRRIRPEDLMRRKDGEMPKPAGQLIQSPAAVPPSSMSSGMIPMFLPAIMLPSGAKKPAAYASGNW